MSPDTTVFHWPARVYWEDTDAGGIVYYANYLKFFERARTEWLRHLEVSQSALAAETGLLFVVAEASLRYRSPARLDDTLDLQLRLTQLGSASITVQQQAWRPAAGETAAQLLVEGEVRVGCVRANADGIMQPGRLPAPLRQRLTPWRVVTEGT